MEITALNYWAFTSLFQLLKPPKWIHTAYTSLQFCLNVTKEDEMLVFNDRDPAYLFWAFGNNLRGTRQFVLRAPSPLQLCYSGMWCQSWRDLGRCTAQPPHFADGRTNVQRSSVTCFIQSLVAIWCFFCPTALSASQTFRACRALWDNASQHLSSLRGSWPERCKITSAKWSQNSLPLW